MQNIKKYLSRDLLGATLKNSIQVIVKFITGLLSIKLIALFVGPNGLALVGQFQNFLQVGANFSSLGFNNGIIKYTAQYQYSRIKQRIFISTGFFAILISSLGFGLLTLIFAKTISYHIFDSYDHTSIVRGGGIFMLTSSSTNFYLSVLNGRQKLKQYIYFNIIVSISSFLIMLGGMLWKGVYGLLWAQNLLLSFVFILSLIALSKHIIGFKPVFSRYIFNRLFTYSLMAIIAGGLTPLTHLLIRTIISHNLSLEIAGLWEGINRISNNYILLLTLSFSYYYLPAFSRLKSKKEINNEIIKGFATISPILIVSGIMLYILRDTLIKTLFTNDFKSMSDLFIWQITGDFFKVLSWVIGYLFIARKKVTLFISTEFLSAILQIVLIRLLINTDLPLNLYYTIENVLYFGIMIWCYIKYFRL